PALRGPNPRADRGALGAGLLEELLPAREQRAQGLAPRGMRLEGLDVAPVRGKLCLEAGHLGLARGDLPLEPLDLARPGRGGGRRATFSFVAGGGGAGAACSSRRRSISAQPPS